ncbi:methyltransferase [Nocardioides sambongensis]|uniref:methyltransferase n=1 Tax=Nocardioides sambongensis TaxID=2589074 RepID=UPI0018C8AAFD|nr:class I SAM-dependent methyltransferase [Nocardioides sambongensis]
MSTDEIIPASDAPGPDDEPAPIDFEGLRIAWDGRVLRPRPWTAEQSRWIAELAQEAPEGPILELCCGAGQIGLLAARLTGRPLVQVDRDPVAVAYARRNAAQAGLAADVREAEAVAALEMSERFPLVLVDPPWLATAELDRFPEDPVGAVDGGVDGLAAVRECLRVALDHAQDGGHVVLQVGSSEQAGAVADLLRWNALDGARGWEIRGIRACLPGGVLVHVGTSGGTPSG